MLTNKNIVLGVTGSVAAYKACELSSNLTKLGANVDVIMTKNSMNFIMPLTFEALTKNRVVSDTFDRAGEFEVKHISLAKKADIILIAPASADIIAKIANGIADDMLSSTVLAATCPIVICPAMNTHMYEAKSTQFNIATLKDRGFLFVEPTVGQLACGDIGKGKMVEPEDIVEYVKKNLIPKQDLKGKTILITVGATREPIDKVRFISNNSSGKMGFELCRAAKNRGAKVILIKGYTAAQLPNNLDKIVEISTTEEMLKAVLDNLKDSDIVIKAAAPADYKVKEFSEQKIKVENLALDFIKNPDIAYEVGKIKGDKKLVVFSAETENLIDNAVAKLKKKNADLVVANDITKKGAGFNVDTNIVTLITNKDEESLPLMTKSEVADAILDKVVVL